MNHLNKVSKCGSKNMIMRDVSNSLIAAPSFAPLLWQLRRYIISNSKVVVFTFSVFWYVNVSSTGQTFSSLLISKYKFLHVVNNTEYVRCECKEFF